MRRLVLCLALLWPAVSGCTSAECAVDTDCPFAMNAYCSLEHRCVPRGTTQDAGGPRDAGGETGPRDGGGDVGAVDAPRTDSGTDAPSSCPAVAESYLLTMVGVGCTGLTASTMTLAGPASMTDCSFEVRLDDMPVGAVSHGDGNTFAGTLMVLGMPAMCTFEFVDDLMSVDVTCGACMFSASR
jgi:hypothetical protein